MARSIHLAILACLLLSGCFMKGNDGADGIPHLGIDWIEKPEYYTDENPDVPQQIIKGEFFETTPQYSNFEYGYSDGYGWVGQYQIKAAEPGEGGKFLFKDGKAGRDGFYTLLLTYSGSQFSSEYQKIQPVDTLRYSIRSGLYELHVKQWPVKNKPGYLPPDNKLQN